MADQSLIEIQRLEKRYGTQLVLDRVDFDVRPKEIHALLGENGAGKSTLIKALAGVVRRDAGEIRIGGRPMSPHHGPADVASAGLAFVHQDLGLIDGLSVAENLALTNGYARRGWFISKRRTERQAAGILDRLAIDVGPLSLVGSLSHDRKVMVAIARAFSSNARALVLDEVSSSLPAPEVARLTEWLRRSRSEGLGYIYVSHRLDEVLDIADRITVLRDGRRVVTVDADAADLKQLVSWITGVAATAASEGPRFRTVRSAARHLEVRELLGPELTEPLDFTAQPGEIVAFCGLVGSGARDVAALLGGAAKPTAGAAWLQEAQLPLGSPVKLRQAGCDYVPGDRQFASAILSLNVRENLFPARRSDGACADRYIVGLPRERASASRLIEGFGIRPKAPEMSMANLSGGNQQKVIMARSLRTGPRLLVLDDPTAGVDVGARAEIHGRLRDSAAAGATVVLCSSDFEEVAALAHRVLVMRHGRVYAQLQAESITEQRLSEASHGTGYDAGGHLDREDPMKTQTNP